MQVYLLVIFLGASIGSFINAFSYRWPKKVSIWRDRSYCPSCKRKLGFIDLIPILSFLWLRGRCRSCKAEISFSYLIIELLLAGGFGLLFHYYGATYTFIQLACLFTLLVICAEVDRKTGLIPNVVLAVGAFVAMALNIINSGINELGLPIVAAVGSCLIMFLIRHAWFFVAAKPGFGMGDVKLVGVIALFIGWNGLWAFYLAAIAGAVIGLAGIATDQDRQKVRQTFHRDTNSPAGQSSPHHYWCPMCIPGLERR